MRKPILHRTIFKLTFCCLLCPIAFKYCTSENSLGSWRIFHSFSKQTHSYCFCDITSHLYMSLHLKKKIYIIKSYYLLLMLFNIFYSLRTFAQTKSVLMNEDLVSWQRCAFIFFHSNSSRTFFQPLYLEKAPLPNERAPTRIPHSYC